MSADNQELEKIERIVEIYSRAIGAMQTYAGPYEKSNTNELTYHSWTKIDYDIFKLDSSVEIDMHKMFEYYGLEDHYFYLACIKGYGTPMKIKVHDDPCPSIEIVSSSCSTSLWPWELEDKLCYIRKLPEMPSEFKWEI